MNQKMDGPSLGDFSSINELNDSHDLGELASVNSSELVGDLSMLDEAIAELDEIDTSDVHSSNLSQSSESSGLGTESNSLNMEAISEALVSDSFPDIPVLTESVGEATGSGGSPPPPTSIDIPTLSDSSIVTQIEATSEPSYNEISEDELPELDASLSEPLELYDESKHSEVLSVTEQEIKNIASRMFEGESRIAELETDLDLGSDIPSLHSEDVDISSFRAAGISDHVSMEELSSVLSDFSASELTMIDEKDISSAVAPSTEVSELPELMSEIGQEETASRIDDFPEIESVESEIPSLTIDSAELEDMGESKLSSLESEISSFAQQLEEEKSAFMMAEPTHTPRSKPGTAQSNLKTALHDQLMQKIDELVAETISSMSDELNSELETRIDSLIAGAVDHSVPKVLDKLREELRKEIQKQVHRQLPKLIKELMDELAESG